MILHAGLIALRLDGLWRGALIEGASGAGKSDLALRALDHGFRLVADDRVVIWRSGEALYGRAPDPLAGLLEVRGLGVLAERRLEFCRIGLVVTLGEPERAPEPMSKEYLGLSLPEIRLPGREASAPAKLRRAMQHLGAGPEGAYLSPLALGAPSRSSGDSR